MDYLKPGTMVKVRFYEFDEQFFHTNRVLAYDDGLLTIGSPGRDRTFNLRSAGFLSVERVDENVQRQPLPRASALPTHDLNGRPLATKAV